MKSARQKQREEIRIHESARIRAGNTHTQFCVRWYEGRTRKQKCFGQLRDAKAFAAEIRRALAALPANPGMELRTFEIESGTLASLEARAENAGETVNALVRRILADFLKA